MEDEVTADMDRRRRRIIRQVRIRAAAVVLLVLVVVFNDEVIMRALFMALLVPLMRDFQRRLNNHAVRKFQDEMIRHAAQRAAEYRAAEQE